MDWIQAQHDLRKKREVVNCARRELNFLEGLKTKRQKYLSKKSTSIVKDQQQFWRQKNESKTNSSDKNDSAKKSVEDELDDLLLNDDFAPEMYSDSDASDEDNDDEPEFYPNRVRI